METCPQCRKLQEALDLADEDYFTLVEEHRELRQRLRVAEELLQQQGLWATFLCRIDPAKDDLPRTTEQL